MNGYGKWSNGIPSDNEAIKGEYSGAFKRAGFMWGIGRELYEYPILWATVGANDTYERSGKKMLSNKFRPKDWGWMLEEGRLVAYDKDNNKRVDVKFELQKKEEESVDPEVLFQEIVEIVQEHDVDKGAVKKAYGVTKFADLENIALADLLDLHKKLKAKYEGSDRATESEGTSESVKGA